MISIVQEKSFDDLIVLLSSKGLQQDSHADIKTMPQNHAWRKNFKGTFVFDVDAHMDIWQLFYP